MYNIFIYTVTYIHVRLVEALFKCDLQCDRVGIFALLHNYNLTTSHVHKNNIDLQCDRVGDRTLHI